MVNAIHCPECTFSSGPLCPLIRSPSLSFLILNYNYHHITTKVKAIHSMVLLCFRSSLPSHSLSFSISKWKLPSFLTLSFVISASMSFADLFLSSLSLPLSLTFLTLPIPLPNALMKEHICSSSFSWRAHVGDSSNVIVSLSKSRHSSSAALVHVELGVIDEDIGAGALLPSEADFHPVPSPLFRNSGQVFNLSPLLVLSGSFLTFFS